MAGNANSGRPTKYKSEYAEQARKLCLVGYTDEELADFFGVDASTISNWKIDYPVFLEAIKAGKEVADSNVTDRLYQRAMGFEHDSEEIKVVNYPDLGPLIERVPVRKIYPPDPTSMIFWLKNRQRKKWRDKTETGFTDGEGNDLQQPLINIQIVQPSTPPDSDEDL